MMIDRIRDFYGEDKLISVFFSFVKRHRKEEYLYPDDGMVEKTSDKQNSTSQYSNSF